MFFFFFFQDRVTVQRRRRRVTALLTARMLSRERTSRILRSVELLKLERRSDVPLASRRRRARGSYHGWAVSEREGSEGSPRHGRHDTVQPQHDTVRRDAIHGTHFPSSVCSHGCTACAYAQRERETLPSLRAHSRNSTTTNDGDGAVGPRLRRLR